MCILLSVHGPRWCADSWDTMGPSELPPMQSLARAMEPSGWIMWTALAQSHPWTDVHSMDGAMRTVGIVKMQEWCAKKVNKLCVLCVFIQCVHLYINTVSPTSNSNDD